MKKKLFVSALLGLMIAGLAPMDIVGFKQTAEAQALRGACQTAYSRYRARRGPKAFAVGSNGACGSYWGAANLAATRNGAVNACRRYGGQGCRVVESSF